MKQIINLLFFWHDYYVNGVREFQPEVSSTLGLYARPNGQRRRRGLSLVNLANSFRVTTTTPYQPRVEATLGSGRRGRSFTLKGLAALANPFGV
ncbi:MAG TPA: hypothetical protein VIR01_02970 [Pyrinomonadaceae bacterium]